MPDSAPDVHVRLDRITRRFREGDRLHTVLQELSGDFRRGEAVALCGRSGSGKSTLLNLICGIDLADEGDVLVDGRNVMALSETARTLFRRRHTGFVYQAFNLVPTLSVADNVRLTLELNGVGRAAASERVANLLDAVSLGDRADSYPEQLSGGEQQRVAIARALAHRPALILADEPTGNLDSKNGEAVMTLLKGLHDEGSTICMVTHDPRYADHAERKIHLFDGRVVAEPVVPL